MGGRRLLLRRGGLAVDEDDALGPESLVALYHLELEHRVGGQHLGLEARVDDRVSAKEGFLAFLVHHEAELAEPFDVGDGSGEVETGHDCDPPDYDELMAARCGHLRAL